MPTRGGTYAGYSLVFVVAVALLAVVVGYVIALPGVSVATIVERVAAAVTPKENKACIVVFIFSLSAVFIAGTLPLYKMAVRERTGHPSMTNTRTK